MNMSDLLAQIRRVERRPDNLECLLIAAQNMASEMYRAGDVPAGGVSDAITDALIAYEEDHKPAPELTKREAREEYRAEQAEWS